MNTFVLFASILAQAQAHPLSFSGVVDTIKSFILPGLRNHTTPITIKDNRPYLLDIGKIKCDGTLNLKTTLNDEPSQQAYLYPIVQYKQDIKLFKLTNGSYVEDDTYKKSHVGKYPKLPPATDLANYKIKRVEYTSNKQKLRYSVYVIPPKVSPGSVQGKGNQLKFNITAAYECITNGKGTLQNSLFYKIVVTNNARTVTLVSSTLVLAISSILLL
ncbi:hypothetical protein DSO57_1038238 [Entomophthora muscae]|uniref:Uncharacterized protein n=2 Tax=Entomophthora muscae TaxID=34485 RepID=A0ACC2RT38_9FUNG|nr:hypothetical protein DSO57_1027064 [Entomophthora muscae]KAJ9067535.1 hypothetical protein DSO57_1038238 [Entomophthora muscae]